MTPPAHPELEHLYVTYYRAVLRYVVRRIDDPDSAPDLTADVFLVAVRRTKDVPRDRPLPWLYGVARRKLAERRRSAQREAVAYIRAGDEWVVRTDAGLEWPVDQSAEFGDVATALRELSEADQEVLRLVAWEELGGRDLGVALGCSAATATVRLHRARKRLKQILQTSSAPPGHQVGSTGATGTEPKTQGERS